jgi:hypothetical protein
MSSENSFYSHEAEALLGWAQTRIQDLDALRADLVFLDSVKNARILLAVDAYDLLDLAFPSTLLPCQGTTAPFDEESQTNILETMIARGCLFYGLPSEMYPILIPPCYANQISGFLTSSSVLHRQPNVDKQYHAFLEKIDQLGLSNTPSSLDVELCKRRELADLLTELCPDLLFLLSGISQRGLTILRSAIREKVVSIDLRSMYTDELRFGKLLQEDLLADFAINFKEEDLAWAALYRRILRDRPYSWHDSWWPDVHAIRLVRHLNKKLNPHNTIVLLVSGASALGCVLRSEEALERSCCHHVGPDGQSVTRSFFRGLDVFRFYVKYARQLATESQPVHPSTVVGRIDRDLHTMRALFPDCPDRISGISVLGPLPDRTITNSLAAQIDNVRSMKKELISADLVQHVNLLIRSGVHGSLDGHYDYGEELLNTRAQVPDEIIDRVLFSLDQVQQEIAEAVVEKEVFLTNEFLGWLGISGLRDCQADESKLHALFAGFTLFPFRVRFRSAALLEHVNRLKELHRHPSSVSSSVALSTFFGLLSDLASSCASAPRSKHNLWRRQVMISNIEDTAALERRLAFQVILLGLGHYGLVRDDARRMSMLPHSSLTAEFRISEIQARIGEVLAAGADVNRRTVKEIVEICRTWTDRASPPDPRLLHLMAFAGGMMARSSLNGQSKWLEDFGRRDVLATCKKALNVLYQNSSRVDDKAGTGPDWDDRHLIASIMSNMAYYLAVDGSGDDIRCAVDLYRDLPMTDDQLTSLCLHNKGYVFLNQMEMISKSLAEVKSCYELSKQSFLESDKKRYLPLGIEKIFSVHSSELDSILEAVNGEAARNSESPLRKQPVISTRLAQDAIRLERSFRRRVDELQQTA